MATVPLQKLVTDIIYLPFGQKQLYLSSVQDLYNDDIISYLIGELQDTDFVLHILSQLNHLPEGCTLHSDQGGGIHNLSLPTSRKRKRHYHEHVP